jgi:hypothetical protein
VARHGQKGASRRADAAPAGSEGTGKAAVMTTHTTPTLGSASATARDELLDALMEVIVRARGPVARAVVVADLVQEMCATVEWLHHYGTDLDDAQPDELSGIARLAEVAQEHRRKMSARQPHATLRQSPLPPQADHLCRE